MVHHVKLSEYATNPLKHMKHIFSFFCKRHTLAIVISVLLILGGLKSATQMQRDAFPTVDFGVVTIVTVDRNTSAEDIELKITNKIEDAINGLSGNGSLLTA